LAIGLGCGDLVLGATTEARGEPSMCSAALVCVGAAIVVHRR
jgi:hypothetical protein